MPLLVFFLLGAGVYMFSALMLKWATFELTDAGYLSHTMTYQDALQVTLPVWIYLFAVHVLFAADKS